MAGSFEQISKLKNVIINQSILVAFAVGLITFLLSLLELKDRSNHIYVFTDLFVVVVFGFIYFTRHSILARTKSLFSIAALLLFLISNTMKHGAFGYSSIILIVPFFANMFFSVRGAFGFLVFFLVVYLALGFLIITGQWEIVSDATERNNMAPVWITKAMIVGSMGAIILIITHRFNSTFEKLIINLDQKNKNLLQREANLQSIFESTESMIGLFDVNKRLVEYNSAFEKSARDNAGIKLSKNIDLISKLDQKLAASLSGYLDAALRGRKYVRTSELDAGSEKRYYLVSHNPIYQGEEITGVVMFAQDITQLKQAQNELRIYNEKLEELVAERTKALEDSNSELLENNALLDEQRVQLQMTIDELKRTQQQLVESEKMASLGVMSAGIAHEINNPLNFIYGGVHGLKDEIGRIGDDGTQTKINPYIKIIDDGVKRATDIVKSLSHFSRQTASNEETCDLHQIINNCLSILNSSLKDKVVIEKNFTKQNRPIQGNAGKLHQVFVNLISNAEQAIGEKGTIKISTKMTEKLAEVSIEDDGSGISEDNLSKIMDPFFTTKAPGVGTGLGLSITKKIINEHNGKLKVTSKLNQGTIFVVELPISPTT